MLNRSVPVNLNQNQISIMPVDISTSNFGKDLISVPQPNLLLLLQDSTWKTNGVIFRFLFVSISHILFIMPLNL